MAASASPRPQKGPSTTHLTVSDKWGNIVSYTFTIEQTGGSAITVPGHGFILNNELTDFEPVPGLANSPEGGKRPRSSISPTIVTDDRHPDPRARFSRGLHDHHDRSAGARQRPRLRHDPSAGDSGAEGLAAQHGTDLGRTGVPEHARGAKLLSPSTARPSSRRRRSGLPQASPSSQEGPCRPPPSPPAAAGGAHSWRSRRPEAPETRRLTEKG